MIDAADFSVRIIPDQTLIQLGRNAQRLSLDFWIESQSTIEWMIYEIGLTVYDQHGHCLLKRRLDQQAVSPSIATLPERTLPPRGSLYVFNPFPVFDPDLNLHRLAFTFHLQAEPNKSVTLIAEVFPRPYQQQTSLIIPLKGRILVDDGNDDLSHHRRVLLNHPGAQAMGLTSNDQRYAWDFVLVNEVGQDYQLDEMQLENFLSFGTPLYAPGDGVVAKVRNDIKDNPPYQVDYTDEDFAADPWLSSGNLVIIDHGMGEFSQLVHCQQGSLLVNEGDQVRQGQPIARLGNSGWTYRPHLHFQLTDSPDIISSVNVLPVQFSEFALVVGAETRAIHQGYPDTGEVIIVD